MKGGSQAALERRYEIVPQMRDYDLLEEKTWVPYLMLFHPPGLSTASFTTDENGFRRTLWKGRPLDWAQYNVLEGTRAALIGGSTAFGVGASSDAFTLASLMNERENQAWFNFAGRAFNSTQEWLAFLLFLPRDVKTVLILSGVNNLALSHLAHRTSPVYNSFYAQSIFERSLQSGAVTGLRASMKLLLSEITQKLSFRDNGQAHSNGPCRYEDILVCFRRDMRLWALLRDALGFDLYFVFQPVASWAAKALTHQEREVFEILDQGDPSGTWESLSGYLNDQGKSYVPDVRRVCEEFKVPFLDLNTCASFAEEQWLFVDRAHLTDQGYRLAAQEIRGKFPL